MPGRLLDTEIAFRGSVPDDLTGVGIQGVTTTYYDPLDARERQTNQPLDNNALLKNILKNTDIDILLKTIGNAFFPRAITIGTTPTQILTPNRSPRGYILINPNTTVSGVVTNVTVFPAGTTFRVGITNSAALNVSGHGAAAFILNITEASAGPVVVSLQTLDPISGNWAIAQTDIFSGALAIGTYYANVGPIGIDDQARIRVEVIGDSMTGSIAAILKPALAGTIAGPTIFLGNEDVNATIGFPLLSGQKETFYLRENTPLYGVAAAATVVNLFELQ